MSKQTKTVLDMAWVVAEPAGKVVWQRGSDYPHLCDTCRMAIDTAVQVLPIIEPWGPMYDPEDPEVAFMYAYDHAWLCGGHESNCVREPEVDIVAGMTVQSTTWVTNTQETVEETWDILPIWGNGRDLGQLATQVAGEIGDKARAYGYRVITVIDAPGNLRTEIEFEVFFEEKTDLEALYRAAGYEVWHEYEV